MNGEATIKRRTNSNVKKEALPTPIQSISPSNGKAKGYPQPSELPYGQSVIPEIWRRDPASTFVKNIYILLTITGLIGLWLMSSWVPMVWPKVDMQWDQMNGIDPNQNLFLALPMLIQKTLYLPPETVQALFQATGAVVVAFILADVFMGGSSTSKTSPWPKSWNIDNTMCYHEMFSEPTRFGRLLRRPGNTLSNAPYFLGSLCVLASVAAQLRGGNQSSNDWNKFWLADAQFGVMLFLLAATSFLWHGSNAPWSQYPDIWSMECCIAYLIIRQICMGVLIFFIQYLDINPESGKTLAGGACFVIYSAAIILEGRNKWSYWQKGFLHGGCPFSARARLLGIADVWGQGQQDVVIATAAIFVCMPVLYLLFPLLVPIYQLNCTGSVLAGDLICQTLVVGWTYRMLDRWLLDGNALMNYFVSLKPSILRTFGCAILSPTAALHFFTGITLVAAYVHTRSIDDCFETVIRN